MYYAIECARIREQLEEKQTIGGHAWVCICGLSHQIDIPIRSTAYSQNAKQARVTVAPCTSGEQSNEKHPVSWTGFVHWMCARGECSNPIDFVIVPIRKIEHRKPIRRSHPCSHRTDKNTKQSNCARKMLNNPSQRKKIRKNQTNRSICLCSYLQSISCSAQVENERKIWKSTLCAFLANLFTLAPHDRSVSRSAQSVSAAPNSQSAVRSPRTHTHTHTQYIRRAVVSAVTRGRCALVWIYHAKSLVPAAAAAIWQPATTDYSQFTYIFFASYQPKRSNNKERCETNRI